MCVDDELWIDHAEKFELIHDRRDTFLMHDSCFKHLFHGELGVVLSLDSVSAYSPYFAEPTSADGVLVVKHAFVESYTEIEMRMNTNRNRIK